MSARICFICHGETDWNAAKRIQGQTDTPLNDTGRRQAQAMASHAEHRQFDAVYSSDLQRARETAQQLAEKHGLEVRALSLLRERYFGIFQGLTVEEGLQRYPAE